MTVKELRVLVDNLDEYIRLPGGIDRLKKTILHLAVSGQLVPQDPSEGTGEELYQQIKTEKAKLVKEGRFKKQNSLSKITADEIPFEIPKSWRWVRPIEIGGVNPRNQLDDNPVIGFIPMAKISEDYGKTPEFEQRKWDDVKKNFTHFANGDVVLAKITPCFENSKAGVICGLPNSYGAGTTELHVFRQSEKFVVPEYFYMWVKNPIYLEIGKTKMTGSAGQKRVPTEFFASFPVPLPPLLEQQRIVKKVNIVFRLISELSIKYQAELAERRKLVASSLAQLSHGQSGLALQQLTEIIRTKADAAELRKTILHLAVSGQLVPQDPSEGTGEQLYQQIQAEKAKLIREGMLKKQKSLPEITPEEIPFKIPKTWKWSRLADATIFSIGRTPARKDNTYWDDTYMPWVSIADLKAGEHISQTKESVSKKAFEKCFNGQAVPAGSLLYSFKLTIGKMSIVDIDAVHNEAIASFNTFTSEMTDFLFKALEVIDPTERSNSAVMGKTLNSTSLSLLEIPLPPLAEQTRIVQKTAQLLNLVTQLEKHLEK